MIESQQAGPATELARLTREEIAALTPTIGKAGIETRTLGGDPTGPGLYTIELAILPDSKVPVHFHPEDRHITVISGVFHVGFGSSFDPAAMRAMPAGSFYSEPALEPHFAKSGPEGAVIRISGIGPTATIYP